MNRLILLATLLVASVSAFAFQPRETMREVDNEVRQRVANGESLEAIANAAKIAGVSVDVLTSSLILAGKPSTDVVAALISVGFNASSVINAAVNLGGSREALNAVAISKGVDPTTLLASTAAGGGQSNAGAGGGQPNAGGQPSLSGFSTSSFGQSRASTVGGGGRSSVSGS